MLDELLGDLFEREGRDPRQRGQQRRGFRGFLERLLGGDDDERGEDRLDNDHSGRRDHRRPDRESPLDWD
jgi:hypothetical protein